MLFVIRPEHKHRQFSPKELQDIDNRTRAGQKLLTKYFTPKVSTDGKVKLGRVITRRMR